MNELQIFNSAEFGEVRTVVVDGIPWFVGKDVCEAFGDTNYRRSLAIVDEEDKGVSQINTQGGMQSMAIINESGLYSLLFHMQPQKAKGVSQNDTLIEERIEKLNRFRKWVTKEVLPQIRKTGTYSTMDKSTLSPQLQLSYSILEGLANMEMRQQKLETKVDNICEIFAETIGDWKDEINAKVRDIAQKSNSDYKTLWNQLYLELEKRAKCNLSRLAENKKRRLKDKGLTKTAIEKECTKLAVIFDNNRIKEIFTTIVKEFAIKYCA